MEIEKEFIVSESSNLDREDRIEILNIVKRYDIKFIKEKRDGSRVRLDRLPEDAVMQIYDFVRRRIEIGD